MLRMMLRTRSPHVPAPRIPRIASVGLSLCAFAVPFAAGSAQATQTRTKAPKPQLPASARPQPNNPGNVGNSVATTTTAPQTTSSQPGSTITTNSTATTATSPATSPGVGTRTTPGTKPTKQTTSTKLSTPALALAILAALLALACLVWGVARLTAYEPRWVLSMRHSLAEGGFRASATWAEFTDWARLGK
jgi:cobalamin biosynthesis Mg chelatase CobN